MTAPAVPAHAIERDLHLADIIRTVERLDRMPPLRGWRVGVAADGAPWLTARLPVADGRVAQTLMRAVADRNPSAGPWSLDVTDLAPALTTRIGGVWVTVTTGAAASDADDQS